MTSPPPEAAGAAGGHISEGPPDERSGVHAAQAAPLAELTAETLQAPQAAPLPAAPFRQEGGARPSYGQRPLPPAHASGAPVELTLDLRSTPPDKVLARLFGALEQVGGDVTLLVVVRDTPEYVGVTSSVYQALRDRGYVSDSSRLPQGGQRLRIQRRRDNGRNAPRERTQPEAEYAPPPPRAALDGGDGQPAEQPEWLPVPEREASGGAFEGER